MLRESRLHAPVEGLILDFGGTIDTNGCHWGKMLWHAYERQHVPVSEEQFRKAYVDGERALEKNPFIKADYTFRKTLHTKLRLEMEWLCTSGAWDADGETFERMLQAVLDDVYQRTSDTIARSRKVLELLHERLPMVLVTNFYGNMHAVLEEFQLAHLFDVVVESAVVGIRKPDARIFKMGVQALQMEPSRIVSVGDSFYKDVEPSKKVGCQTVWIKGEGWTDAIYDEAFPEAVITDFAALSELVELV